MTSTVQHTALGRADAVYGRGLDALFPLDWDTGEPVGVISAPWPPAGFNRSLQPTMFDQATVEAGVRAPHFTEIDPRDLYCNQDRITRAGVQYYLGTEWERTGRTFADQFQAGNQYPVVYVQGNGNRVILSGHHRIAAALTQGRSIRVNLIESPQYAHAHHPDAVSGRAATRGGRAGGGDGARGGDGHPGGPGGGPASRAVPAGRPGAGAGARLSAGRSAPGGDGPAGQHGLRATGHLPGGIPARLASAVTWAEVQRANKGFGVAASALDSYVRERTGQPPEALTWTRETHPTSDHLGPEMASASRATQAEQGYREHPEQMPPVVILEDQTGKREHIDGWHRLIGAERAGLDQVPAYVARWTHKTKTAAMAGPIYRGFTVTISDATVAKMLAEDWSGVYADVLAIFNRPGAAHSWEGPGVDATVGVYWSHQEDVARQFTANPTVTNILPVVVRARYEDTAAPGVPVGRSDTDYYVKGGEHEQTLSPGTPIEIDQVDIGFPNLHSYAPDPRDPEYLIEQITGRTWRRFSGTTIRTQANLDTSKIAFPSWRDRGTRPRAEALIAPDLGRARGNSYEVFLYDQPEGHYPTLAAAQAYVEEIYGPLDWQRVPGDPEPHWDRVWGLTDAFNDADWYLTVDRLPRLGTTAGAVVQVPIEKVKNWASADAVDWDRGVNLPVHTILDEKRQRPNYQHLVEDVRQNGIKEPLIKSQGLLVDGHTRLAAAIDTGLSVVPVQTMSREQFQRYRDQGRPDITMMYGSTRLPRLGTTADKYDPVVRTVTLKGQEFVLTYDPLRSPWRRAIQATANGAEAGYLLWDFDNTVSDIGVQKKWQRRGLATAMWRFVKDEIVPDLQHGRAQLPDGKAWAQTVTAMSMDHSLALRFEVHENDRQTPGLNPFGVTWVYAYDGDQMVGWLGFCNTVLRKGTSYEKPRGEIYDLKVEEAYRRRGVATRLLEEARQVEPSVHHSWNMSDDGKAWSEKTATAPGTSFTHQPGEVPIDTEPWVQDPLYVTFDWVHPQIAVGGALLYPSNVVQLAQAGVVGIISGRDDFLDATLDAGHATGVRFLSDPTHDDGGPKPTEWFKQALDFALPILRAGGKVYCHCYQGVNRGPSLAYAVLRAYTGMSPGDAFAALIEARPFAWVDYADDADRALAELGYARTTAGAKGDLPEGLTFEHHDPNPEDPSQAVLYAVLQGSRIGGIGWNRESNWKGPLGRVHGIYVDPAYQRRGVATALWSRAKEIEPALHHSTALTDDGKGWSGTTAAREEVSPGKWGWVRNFVPGPNGLTFGDMFGNEGPMQRVDGNGPSIGAWIGEQYVGHIFWDQDTGEVSDIWVNPAHRHRGIATDLWQEAKRRDPRVKHSEEQTKDGQGWAKHVGVAPRPPVVKANIRPTGHRAGGWQITVKTASTGTFWRVHPDSRQFGPQDATSKPFFNQPDGTQAQKGYSCFQSPWHLYLYVLIQWAGLYDGTTVLRFSGDKVGVGTDGEDLAMPTGLPWKTTWGDFVESLPQYPLPATPAFASWLTPHDRYASWQALAKWWQYTDQEVPAQDFVVHQVLGDTKAAARTDYGHGGTIYRGLRADLPPVFMESEAEVTIRPGATLTITGVDICNAYGFFQAKGVSVLHTPIRAQASRGAPMRITAEDDQDPTEQVHFNLLTPDPAQAVAELQSYLPQPDQAEQPDPDQRQALVYPKMRQTLGPWDRDLMHSVTADQGFSFHDHPGDGPTSGYMVSIEKGSETKVPLVDLSPENVADYMSVHQQELKDPDNFLGGWVFKGNCFLDVSRHVADEQTAMRLAQANHQIAIYDLDTHSTVLTQPAGSV